MDDGLEGGPLLAYRPLESSDRPLIESILCDAATLAQSLLEPIAPEQARRRLDEMMTAADYPGSGLMAIVERRSNRAVGYGGIQSSWLERVRFYEFTLMLRSEAWGQGYGSEAAETLLHYQRRFVPDKVFAIVDSDNRASLRVLQRAGMQRVRRSCYGKRPVEILLI